MDTREFNVCMRKIQTDKEALSNIYAYYYPRIILHIHRSYPKVSAEDIAQEFFLNLLKYNYCCYIKNPASWIYVSCDNLIKKKYGQEKVCIELEKCNIDSGEILIDEIIVQEDIDKVFSAIEDRETREIIYLCYWEGYSLREVAELINKNKSTVKQKHTRAIKKLKQVLPIL